MGLTLEQALQLGKVALSQAGIESATIDARVLVKHVCDVDDTFLYTYPEKLLSAAQQAQYEQLLSRRVEGEPIAYILGYRDFWDMRLQVSSATLIPRPETEVLVETALAKCTQTGLSVCDLGTGTGAIALALAKEQPTWQVIGVDLIDDAVALAKSNAAQLKLPNVTFRQSRWFAALSSQSFHLIVSNPPYVEPDSPYLQQGDLRFEPSSALTAKDNGMADIAHVIATAPDFLAIDGWLMIEHGYAQAESVRQLLVTRGFSEVESVCDLQGHPRITLGQWRA
ncbi:peptide chain release factor N(5)-glutamine methyltransferase [Alteromonas sp. ASW11-36]|uniref:Release factor glutamine methyltransferase n=1 Tax=Alteromonas arenosi TaxID=3055817 RepID=A0ABT7SYC0_9ALTE|nr:peptide chain release factor N(5)-glutamine methyltransferase [Alteromonas sp. ASW11-36]MDM7861189.1 peptide chain release factor N(5)-glutamine methyltransferase [Alteromonas sp. ASW11-36]